MASRFDRTKGEAEAQNNFIIPRNFLTYLTQFFSSKTLII